MFAIFVRDINLALGWALVSLYLTDQQKNDAFCFFSDSIPSRAAMRRTNNGISLGKCAACPVLVENNRRPGTKPRWEMGNLATVSVENQESQLLSKVVRGFPWISYPALVSRLVHVAHRANQLSIFWKTESLAPAIFLNRWRLAFLYQQVEVGATGESRAGSQGSPGPICDPENVR